MDIGNRERADVQSNRYTEYRSLYTSLKDLVRTSGVRGLFQGVTATAARDAPYAGMYLVCYEKGKEVACESIMSLLSRLCFFLGEVVLMYSSIDPT